MGEFSPALYRAGQGEPLVLVHGFTATWRCWLPTLAFLVPRFEVIAPTLPGHDGGPTPPQRARGLSDATDHLEGLLDDLGVETAHFAGNSMGGSLSLELAKRGRARSVTAISPGGGWQLGDRKEVSRIIRLFSFNQKAAKATEGIAPQLLCRPRSRRFLLRDVMTRGNLVPTEEAIRLVRSSVRCSIVDEVFESMREGTSRVADLDQIKCPVLVTWGDQDRTLPMRLHADRFKQEIPGVRFEVMRGLGHTPMWDDAAKVAAAIADFAEEAERSRSAASNGAGQAAASRG
jgi:pimeloyl-ACP methyl ester carboxylesterase